jgi:site-specific DNA recombinase
MDNRMPRAAFYGRHSTDKQDIQMQVDAAKRFCLEHGYDLIDTTSYVDKAVSATKVGFRSRDGLMRLIADIDKSKFDMVVAYSDNRLARDPVEHAQIRILLAGIPVILCDSGREYNPENGDLLSQIIKDGASKFEVDQTRERTRDTFISKVGRGQHIGGKLPYGVIYQKRTGKYVVDPRYQATLRRIFEMYRQGNGFRAIAITMRWYKKDDTPNKEKVKSILINPFYAGYVSMYKVKQKSRLSVQDISKWILQVSDKIEPLISYEQWLACFDLYTKKKEHRSTVPSTRTPFILAGLLHCANHAEPMKTKNQTKIVRNQFGERVRYGSRIYYCDQCNCSIDAQAIHNKVLQVVLTHIVPKRNTDWNSIKEQLNEGLKEDAELMKNTIDLLQVDIEKNARLMKTANQKLETFVLDSDKYKQPLQILEAYRSVLSQQSSESEIEQSKLEKQLERMQTIQDLTLDDIRLDAFHERHLRRLVTNLIQSITVSPTGTIVDIQARMDMDSDTSL